MAIEFRHITKQYGSVKALGDVSLQVDEGEFVTLLGPSGCGKTTLLRIAAGLINPDEGDVLIDGEVFNQVPANQRPTGMVFQNYALFPHMTVEKNVSFGLRMRGSPLPEIEHGVREGAELVGISHLLDRYPSELSGGQQQRVALARTLAIQPSVLLLDEPLAALDRKLRIEMRTELRRLLDKVGITSIFVTHDQEEALTMSDRIAVMDHGVVAQYGTPMEIYDHPATSFVATFIGDSNVLEGYVRRSSGNGVVLQAEQLVIPLPSSFSERIDEKVSLLVRPEHLRIQQLETEQQPPDDLSVPGIVSRVTHLGMSVEYAVMLDGGGELRIGRARSRGQTPLEAGSRVWVRPSDEFSYLTLAE